MRVRLKKDPTVFPDLFHFIHRMITEKTP